MSFFKRPTASTHSSSPATGPHMPGLRASDLSAHENANATLDLSNEARARRAAEEAAARTAVPSSSSASDESVCALAPKLEFSEPDGTNPSVTWPGIQFANPSGDVIHSDSGFLLRQKFLSECSVFNRFDGVDKIGIAPATYRIDMPFIDEAERTELIADMNKTMNAPTLATLYDVDKLHQQSPTPRFWCKWPLAIVDAPDNDHMTRNLITFQSPLPDCATNLDLLAFCASKPKSAQTSIPMGLAPGALEKSGMVTFSGPNAHLKFQDREFHSIPVAMKLVSVRNTTDVNFQVQIQAPNTKQDTSSDLFLSLSEKIGMRSNGEFMYAGSSDASLNRVYLMRRTAVFNSPEARRWAAVDRVAEQAKFLADEDGNVSSTNTYNGTSEQVVNVMLCAEPKNLLQYIVASYPDQLVTAAINECVSRPIHNPTGAGIDEGNDFGRVAVPLKALVAVFNHFCDLYCPSKYAINHHKLQLLAIPTSPVVGMHALRVIGERNPTKTTQLEFVVEIIQLPYNGPQRINEKARALLQRIDADHAATQKLVSPFVNVAIGKTRVVAASAAPPAVTRVLAATEKDMWDTPLFAAAAASSKPAVPASSRSIW